MRQQAQLDYDDDDEIAYFTVRWKTRKLVLSIASKTWNLNFWRFLASAVIGGWCLSRDQMSLWLRGTARWRYHKFSTSWTLLRHHATSWSVFFHWASYVCSLSHRLQCNQIRIQSFCQLRSVFYGTTFRMCHLALLTNHLYFRLRGPYKHKRKNNTRKYGN